MLVTRLGYEALELINWKKLNNKYEINKQINQLKWILGLQTVKDKSIRVENCKIQEQELYK